MPIQISDPHLLEHGCRGAASSLNPQDEVVSASAPGIHVTFTAWDFRASSRTYARTRSSWGLAHGSPDARAEASDASGAVPDAPVARGEREPDAEARAASRARASSAAVRAEGREAMSAAGGWSPDKGSGPGAPRGASFRATLARFAAWFASRSSRGFTNAPTGAGRVDAEASGFPGSGRFVLDVAMTVSFSSSSSSTTTSTLEGLPADWGVPRSRICFPTPTSPGAPHRRRRATRLRGILDVTRVRETGTRPRHVRRVAEHPHLERAALAPRGVPRISTRDGPARSSS